MTGARPASRRRGARSARAALSRCSRRGARRRATARRRSQSLRARDRWARRLRRAAAAGRAARRNARRGGASPRAVYAPPGHGDAPTPALLYFHGGGWISGGLASHDAICATLAARGGCRVIAVDYRLAPEHRFPAAFEDGAAALGAIAADPRRCGVDPARLGDRRRFGRRQSRRRSSRARGADAAGAATATVPSDGAARPHAPRAPRWRAAG